MFGLERKLRKVKNFLIVCNEHTTDSTTFVKHLGLNLDNLLSGEIVVTNIISEKGPLTVSTQICPFFDKLLQLPQAAKAELFGIHR